MQIVIDIPDKHYEAIKSDKYGVYNGIIYDVIRNGMPLPSIPTKIYYFIYALRPKATFDRLETLTGYYDSYEEAEQKLKDYKRKYLKTPLCNNKIFKIGTTLMDLSELEEK